MKTRVLGIALASIAALTVLAACGGSDNDSDGGSQGGIRTQKGLAVAALAENLGLGGSASGNEENARSSLPADTSTSSGQGFDGSASKIAYGGDLAYPSGPLQQGGTTGLTVQGYGTASADADSAVVDFYFYRNSGIEPVPFPDSRTDQQEVAEITEADLQPVIDALVAAGVSRDDIEFVGQSYYDKFSSQVTLRGTIKNIGALDAALGAAESAAKGLGDIAFSTNIAYTVNDCEALEIEAIKAAVEDTGERAANFASALGVQIGAIVGAANFSYFGGPTCGSSYGGPYPLAGDIGYAAGQSGQVQIFANITVTYAIQ